MMSALDRWLIPFVQDGQFATSATSATSPPRPIASPDDVASHRSRFVTPIRAENHAHSPAVADVANVAEPTLRRAPDADADLLAPSAWVERLAPPDDGESSYESPCASRRGKVEERAGVLLHFCAECGAWGTYGYDVYPRLGKLGRWYCRGHRPLANRVGEGHE
jgi:hypothetical protein